MYINPLYTLSVDDPTYPGNLEPLRIEPITEISKGDVANQSSITIFNHDGTHLDGPQHFNRDSRKSNFLSIQSSISVFPNVTKW